MRQPETQPQPVVLTPSAMDELAAELARRARAQANDRLLVGIAGIPGSGKSVFAEQLHDRLARHDPSLAVVLPMDGFHLTNAVLADRGLTDRKGAAETFDAVSYIALLRRFRERTNRGPFPIYDRGVHEPVLRDEPGQRVEASTRLILTEGNYLLLDREPWRELAEVLDETWLLSTPIDQARQWIIQRHRAVGRSPAEAEQRYTSDRRNAELVLRACRPPARVFQWPDADAG